MSRLLCVVALMSWGCVTVDFDDVELEEHVDALTSSTVLRTQIPCTKTQYPILRVSQSMIAGAPYAQVAAYAATNNAAGPVMQGAQIQCRRASDGVTEWRSVFTTRNHEGSAYGTRVIAVRDLFVPATSGTYTCELLAHAADRDSTHYLTVQATASTYLTVSRANPGASTWRDQADVRVAPSSAAYVMRQSWSASAAAPTIDVNGDVELTDMAWASDEHCGAVGTLGANATATATLYATQLDAAGYPCRAATTVTNSLLITPTIHHAKIYNSLRDVPVCRSSACAYAGKVCTNRFAIKTLVRALGNPICIHLPRYSDSSAFND